MQRARRLASVAVVAAVAVTGLSACRSQPDVAADLAAGNISVARVQQVYKVAQGERVATLAKEAKTPPDATGQPAPPAPPLTPDAVLDTLVSHQVLMTLAQRHNVQMPSPLPLAQYAKILHLPDTSEYLKIDVEVEALQFALNQGGQGGPLTDSDLRDTLERLKALNLADQTTTLQQFTATLTDANKKVLGTAVALRNEVGQQHARLNPRYQPFEIPLLTQRSSQTGAAQILVAQPVGSKKASVPVTDVG
jgi:hypothetical protein